MTHISISQMFRKLFLFTLLFLSLFKLQADSAGDKVLRAFVDSKCEIAESNENNNQLTETYTVY